VNRQLILFPEAEEEAIEAAAWYEQQQTGLGTEWLAELDRLIERIAEGPATGFSMRCRVAPADLASRRKRLRAAK
jgi:hypothetical protein